MTKCSLAILLFFSIILTLSAQNRVKKVWQNNINKYTLPIASLNSSDYSDLSFLNDLLKDKNYIFIGESSHEIEEYYVLRTRLIKYLYFVLGYKVIAFEYEKVLSVGANYIKQIISVDSLQRYFLHIKPSKGTTELISFIKSNNIRTTGFDIQYTYPNLFHVIARKHFSNIPDSILYHDSLACYGKFPMPRLVKEWQRIINDTNIFMIKNNDDWEIYKNIQNRVAWTSLMPGISPQARDSFMAENITWLIKNIYPNEKIIFLAHNFHISKCNINYKTLASYLPDTIVKKSYFLGLYGYQGSTGINGANSDLVLNKKNSLGAILNSANQEIVFCDLSRQNESKENSWMFSKRETISWAFQRPKIIPIKYYDGVIQIKNVTSTSSE